MKKNEKVLFLSSIVNQFELVPEEIIIKKVGYSWVATDFENIVVIDDSSNSSICRELNKHFKEIISIAFDPFGTMKFMEIDDNIDMNMEWLTPEQAADYLQISMSYLNQLVREGKIKVYSPEKKIRRFKKEDLDKFIKGEGKRRGKKPSNSFPL